jgi:hypothetical protein
MKRVELEQKAPAPGSGHFQTRSIGYSLLCWQGRARIASSVSKCAGKMQEGFGCLAICEADSTFTASFCDAI